MEQQKDFKQCKSMLHILRFLYFKVFLNLIDVVSVAICFWTIFGLIYITFLKDFAEIFIYATMKYACRLRWLYRILKMDKSMKLKEDIAPTVALSHNSSAAICDAVNTAFASFSSNGNNNEQLRKCSPLVTENQLLQCTPSASVKLLLPASSSSARVKEVLPISSPLGSMKQFLLKSSPAGNTKELPSKSSPSANTKQLLPTNYPTASPVSSISNQIITPRTLDFRHSIDETNFENIDLHSEQDREPDAVILSMDKNLRVKPNLSVRWKFDRIEIFDSFRTKCNNFRSTSCAKMKCNNLAAKIGEVLPTQTEDKETLIVQTDSPQHIGCCGSFYQFLKSKFQVDPIPSCSMPYERF